jgi:citrate synthase
METAGVSLTGDGMRRVALEEMALRRRRLGELTPAQERALETLLVSVADHIFGLVSTVTVRRGSGGQRAAAGG